MITPTDESEMAEAVASAPGPLRIAGGGTRPVGRSIDGAALSVAGVRGITLYDPGALTLSVRAGTPLSEVEAALAAEGQRLAFEPMDHRPLLKAGGAPTIGGVVAANVSGPRRLQVGAARDALLGVRFVDGTGQVVQNGGRVMKNVTGYDLVRLMAGSWGTLGVLTEVSLKVLAAPETEATLVWHGMVPGQGVAQLAAALRTPYEVTGAAHLGPRTLVRIEGRAPSVAYRAGRLQAHLSGADLIEGADSAALWQQVRDVTAFSDRAGAVWRVSVRPSDGPALAAAVGEVGLCHDAVFDWGGGLVWMLVDAGGDGGAAAIRGAVTPLGGHATLVRGPADLRARVASFPPQDGPVAALSQGVRRRFDPRGILNPGLMD